VARHVDHAEQSTVGQFDPSEAQIDGQATILLFLEAVRIRAGQRGNEAALAVVNVTGSADNNWMDLARQWSTSANQQDGSYESEKVAANYKVVRNDKVARNQVAENQVVRNWVAQNWVAQNWELRTSYYAPW
tara:strand:- start:759 stop:1154 length:396 start_codon:yes stop_codon:yes gene_type:complete